MINDAEAVVNKSVIINFVLQKNLLRQNIRKIGSTIILWVNDIVLNIHKNPNEIIVKIRHYVYELAKEKESTPEAVILAFLLKHPGGIRPTIGTTKP